MATMPGFTLATQLNTIVTRSAPSEIQARSTSAFSLVPGSSLSGNRPGSREPAAPGITLHKGGGHCTLGEGAEGTRRNGDVLRQVNPLFIPGTLGNLTDGQFLERYTDGKRRTSELAFATGVERHGAMVLSV